MKNSNTYSAEIEKMRDGAGYAYLIPNIERFGSEDVLVEVGGKVAYYGAASELMKAVKWVDAHRWTLCSSVYRNKDGVVTITA